MSTDTPLELAEHDESILDTSANTLSSSSFIDSLESKDASLTSSQTVADRSSDVGGSSPKSSSRATNSFIPTDTFQNVIDPTNAINTTTPSTCVEGEMHDDRVVELAKDTETMSDNYSTPGFISSLENKDATDAFNFTHADTSTVIATDEWSANAKAEIAYSNKFLSDSINNNKRRKHKIRERYTLTSLLVSPDKVRKRKWRAFFKYDKLRQATFDTQEDGYLFHKMLRKKLAQSESYNDKESIDELVSNIRETILHDNAKKAMTDQNIPKITKIKVEKKELDMPKTIPSAHESIAFHEVADANDLPNDHWKWKDFYSRLGMPKNSSKDEIRKQYLQFTVLYQPSTTTLDNAKDRFQAITEAYEILLNSSETNIESSSSTSLPLSTVKSTSLSDNFSSSLKSDNELNLNAETFIDDASTNNNNEKRAQDRRKRGKLSDNSSSSLKSNNVLNLNAETFKDDARTDDNNEKRAKKSQFPFKRTNKSKTCGFSYTTFNQNTKCWKAYFNFDKFRCLGSFATNNEANNALEAAWNILNQLSLCDNNIRKGFIFKNVYLCFDKRCSKWRSYFTYDKRRQIGTFTTQEDGLLALEMLYSKFHQSDVEDKASIDAIVKQVYDATRSQNIRIKAANVAKVHHFEAISSRASSKSDIATTNNFTESKEMSHCSFGRSNQNNKESIDEIVEHIHNTMSSLEKTNKSSKRTNSSSDEEVPKSSRATNAFKSTDTVRNVIDPTTTININTSNTCIGGEMHAKRAVEPAKDNETMTDNFSSPGSIASLENKDVTNAFNFTRAAQNIADTSTCVTTGESSASAKLETADLNRISGIVNNNKGRKHKKGERILKRFCVSQDKESRKWRAYFFYDKYRQATFERREDGYLFHKILRQKLAQSESYNDKESIDELVTHIRKSILYDKAKSIPSHI